MFYAILTVVFLKNVSCLTGNVHKRSFSDIKYFLTDDSKSTDLINFRFDNFTNDLSKFETFHIKNGGNDNRKRVNFSSYSRRPKFKTQIEISDKPIQMKQFSRSKINNILNRYLTDLYVRKYNKSMEKNNRKTNEKSKVLGETLEKFKNQSGDFHKKFLKLFTVIQFANFKCQTSNANNQYEGKCYHETECTNLNGTAMGKCANGYGVCCVFRFSCGQSSSMNCTYFESPDYPNYETPSSTLPPPTNAPEPRRPYQRTNFRQNNLECSINIYKYNDNIRQIRIDFIDLELLGPTNGTCINERFIITGQDMNQQIPMICGYNTGQHMYIDVATLTGPLQLSVLSDMDTRKRFKIRICQLNATCSNPNNCLQYYEGVTGVVSTFNYDQASMYSRSTPGYFNNLNYAICIRREVGYCTITYTNVENGLEYPFQLRNMLEDNQNVLPPGQAGTEIFNCPNDYITINGIRLCGDKFNDGLINEDFSMNSNVTDTSAGPIIIPVRTNINITGIGFKLFYTQNEC